MKRRKLTMLLCILSVFAVASVGFAAWLITSGAKANATGNITAAPAEDNKVAMTITKVNGQGSSTADATNIIFGKSDDTTNAHPWLLADELENENLVAWFKVSVDTSSLASTYTGFSLEVGDVKVGSADTWNNAPTSATGNYYYVETGVYQSSGDALNAAALAAVAKGSGEVNLWLKVTFHWGDKFAATAGAEGSNPFTFFNNLGNYDATPASSAYHLGDGATQLQELARAALGTAGGNPSGLYNEVNGIGFKVELTANPYKA